MPNEISFRLVVDKAHGVGYVVRTDHARESTFTYLLSRKSGLWINCTQREIREHDIPSECIFPVDEMPVADMP